MWLAASSAWSNSTIVNNGFASSLGGGVDNAGGSLTLRNDTLSGNVRGAIETDQGATGTTVTNTIIGAGFSDGSDLACIAPGRQNAAGSTSAAAITNNAGNNIDHAMAPATSPAPAMQSQVDPKLASIADNGGPTRTQALLAGSPALEHPSTTNCPRLDERGVSRGDGNCDIGAFQAQVIGQPSATAQPVANIGQTQADLGAAVDFAGEAGALRVNWGTAPDALNNSTGEIGEGEISGSTPESTTITGLSPGTKYYFQAFADNASGSASGGVLSFTTDPGPPVISGVTVASVTDTTAKIDFTINPQRSDTSYVINYGPDTGYGNTLGTFEAGSASVPQPQEVTLTNLGPSTTVHFQIVASNGVQEGVSSNDRAFNTDQQIEGFVGASGRQQRSSVQLSDDSDDRLGR